jgi:hypothetical protein
MTSLNHEGHEDLEGHKELQGHDEHDEHDEKLPTTITQSISRAVAARGWRARTRAMKRAGRRPQASLPFVMLVSADPFAS